MVSRNNTEWRPSVVATGKYLGVIEGEWGEVFDLIRLDDRIVFGGCCNAGFLESGFIEREPDETDDELLSELLADLETYYRDGKQYVSRIIFNERM